MKISKFAQWVSLVLCSLIAAMGLSSCALQRSKHRGQVMEEFVNVRNKFQMDQSNDRIRWMYSNLLFQLGDFKQARTVLQPLFNKKDAETSIQFRMAELLYLVGEYQNIEAILRHILEQNPKNQQIRVQAQLYLCFLYYQTNQFQKSRDLFKNMSDKIELPMLDLMQSFGEKSTYAIEWLTLDRQTEIPFIAKEPLPLLSITTQGRKINVFIDTGGDMFFLDPQLADELGIKTVAQAVESFAAGKKATIGFARADELVMGNVILKNVPINVLPIRRFSKMYRDGKYQVGGIIGTNVLRQFLSTVDYPGNKLILRENTPDRTKAFYQQLNKQKTTIVPFTLWATHFMLAQGKINHQGPMTFFVDSGLGSPKCSFSAAKQTLKYLGITELKKLDDKDQLGGGEGSWESYEFFIETLSLDSLQQKKTHGDYGAVGPDMYWENGFIMDGIISHNFLKHYAWTIDFTNRKMIFEK